MEFVAVLGFAALLGGLSWAIASDMDPPPPVTHEGPVRSCVLCGAPRSAPVMAPWGAASSEPPPLALVQPHRRV